MSKSVICNPTWTWAASVLLEVVENGDSPEARANAKQEILKAMRGYDSMLEKHTDYFEEKEVCNHAYPDDGDPRCIHCNAPAKELKS